VIESLFNGLAGRPPAGETPQETREAVDALNGVFQVTAFYDGFPIGTAIVRAILEESDRW
jgi:hypothetical protein